MSGDDEFLSLSGVAKWAGRSSKTISRWVKAGILPEPDVVLPDGRKAWKRFALDNWLHDQCAQSVFEETGADFRRKAP